MIGVFIKRRNFDLETGTQRQYEDGGRSWTFTSQEDKPRKEPILIFCSLPSSFQNCEQINYLWYFVVVARAC